MPLLALHLWLVQKHGNAVPPSEERKPRRATPIDSLLSQFPDERPGHVADRLQRAAAVGFLYPWDLGPQATQFKPAPVGIHPEWYFMSQFQVLKILGDWIPGKAGEIVGMGVFTLAMIVWMLVPLYDASSQAGRRARNATYFGLLLLIATIVTTIWGYLAI